MEKIKLIIYISLVSILLSFEDYSIPTGEEYITGEDGIRRIYVNVWGHVQKPGTYLVYQDIDIMTLLSIAGGPLDGANLSNVRIVSKENNLSNTFNIERLIELSNYSQIKFNPYDTIMIRPTLKYYLLNNASAINMVLQILNLGATLNSQK